MNRNNWWQTICTPLEHATSFWLTVSISHSWAGTSWRVLLFLKQILCNATRRQGERGGLKQRLRSSFGLCNMLTKVLERQNTTKSVPANINYISGQINQLIHRNNKFDPVLMLQLIHLFSNNLALHHSHIRTILILLANKALKWVHLSHGRLILGCCGRYNFVTKFLHSYDFQLNFSVTSNITSY